MKVHVGVATDIGRVREGNEDSYLIEPPLYAVADGMGGHRGGEVASQLALETIEDLFRTDAGSLADQVREANRAVFDQSQEDTAVSGMGTTLTAALVEGSELKLAHVGDSRAYLLRAGALRQLTADHTLVARMVKAGEITEAEAEVHPHRNVLTRSLGTEADVLVDEDVVGLLDGDVGVSADCFLDRYSFIRKPTGSGLAGDSLSRDRRVQTEHRIDRILRRRRAGPVGAKTQNRATRLNALEGVRAFASLSPDAFFHPTHVVAQVKRLNFGDDSELAQTFEILRREHLRMDQSKAPIAFAVPLV